MGLSGLNLGPSTHKAFPHYGFGFLSIQTKAPLATAQDQENTMKEYNLFIHGEWTKAENGRTAPNINPATEEAWSNTAAASAADANRAVASAKEAFTSGPWRTMDVEQRAQILDNIADAIFDRQDELIDAEIADNGNTMRKVSTADIPFSGQTFSHYAQILRETQLQEEFTEEVPVPSRNLVVREPYGVCALIVPWNFPLAACAMKVAPALACGNSMVLKPSPFTPTTALLLAEICHQAGLPPGVLNTISAPENEIGEILVKHPDVTKVAFTGSTLVGKQIMADAAADVKAITLELGGKSPFIILDDADLDLTAQGALFANFFNHGQVCTSGTRVLVPREIHDEFVEKVVTHSKRIKVGDPMDPDTTMGPLVNKSQYDKIMRYIALGKEEGANCVAGGKAPDGFDKGYYVEPTIFANVTNSMKIAQDEIFGPVMSIIPVDNEEEAISIANDTAYGLAGAVWSQDNDRALSVARKIETGTIWINDYHLLNVRFPFGGMKASGFGRELGPWGLDEFCQPKHIHIGDSSSAEEKFYFEMLLEDG
jgi:aldehyde dehydrogenase (NAD+)